MKSLSVASLFLGTALLAGMGYNMPSFSEFDANSDAQVTQVEFDAARAQRMGKNAQEGKMMRNAENAPSFEEIDTDGNGNIDAGEFKVHQQDRLK